VPSARYVIQKENLTLSLPYATKVSRSGKCRTRPKFFPLKNLFAARIAS